MADEPLEGWFTDPFVRHEARWLSDGHATKLVRDGEVTSYDEPPDGPWLESPQRIEPDPSAVSGNDLRRADEAEAADGFDAKKGRWAVYDQLGAQPPSAFDDVARKWPPD